MSFVWNLLKFVLEFMIDPEKTKEAIDEDR
jgi:hypothetical protein